MSNKVRQRGARPSRSTGRSYTQRLQRPTSYRAPRPLPAWLTGATLVTPRLPVLLLLLAEVGHLAAAWAQWPAATGRGVFHVLAAGIVGVTAVAVHFGPNPRLRPRGSDPTRTLYLLGSAAALLAPVGWAVGALAGIAPYLDFPASLAVFTTTLELVAAALLAVSALVAAPGRYR